MNFVPKGAIGPGEALERLVAAIHGEWAIAPIEHIETRAGETFEMDGQEFHNSITTFMRDGRKCTEQEDDERWQGARDMFLAAFNSGILVAYVEQQGRRYTISRDYWGSFFAELTFSSGQLRTDPADDSLIEFERLSVFLEGTAVNKWISENSTSVDGPPISENTNNPVDQKIGKPRSMGPEDTAAQGNKYQKIVVYARKTWPKESGSPGYSGMATATIADRKNEGLKFETIRKVLSGNYAPASKMGISGY